MTKQQIIGVINEAIPEIKMSIFKDDDKGGIGCNQFRELANICRHSDCYDEIEMLIRYNEAKGIEKNKNRKTWAIFMNDNKTTLAQLVIECMRKIKNSSNDEEMCLHDLSLFYGYFYWNARIWAAKNKTDESNRTESNRNTETRDNFNNYHNNKEYQRRR